VDGLFGCGANARGRREAGEGKKGKVRKIEVKSLAACVQRTASAVCMHKNCGG